MKWEVLSRIADRIETDNRFDMSTYSCPDAKCGTVACVGGHIVWEYDPEAFNRGASIFQHACNILDAPYHTGERLFCPPEHIMIAINRNKHLVPAALRWMVEHRKINWWAAGDAVGFDWERRVQ
jgi:hypothetical protein